MSAYTEADPIRLVRGIKYVLIKPLIWHIGTLEGPIYEVPSGFEFDVSVPKAGRSIFDPHDQSFHKAAALHDHMIKAGWNRLTSAGEFHEALKADKVVAWKRMAMFLSVALWKYS